MADVDCSKIRFRLNTGAEMPAIGLGTGQSAPGEVSQAVYAALKAGYRHVDGALRYGNEKEVGQGLQRAFSEGITTRGDVFVTSKLWGTYHDCPADGLEKSLANLGLDYLDLYLMHSPLAFTVQGDPDNISPTRPDGSPDLNLDLHFTTAWEGLQSLPESRARAVGVSNFSLHNLEILLERCDANNLKVPAVNQIELHPFLPQDDVLAYCREKGILLTAYSPLGSTGGPLLENPEIKAFAERKNVSPANILLSWHVARGCAVIPKSVNPARIEANFRVVPLDEDDMGIINNLSKAVIARDGVKRFRPINLGVDLHFPDVKAQ